MSLPSEASMLEFWAEAVLGDSSDEEATAPPMPPPQLYSVEEVEDLLRGHHDSTQLPGLYSNRSFGLKFAYSLLRHADTLDESIIPKQKNKKLPNKQSSGIFLYQNRSANYTSEGVGPTISFSGKRSEYFFSGHTSAIGISVQHGDSREGAGAGLIGRQYQLMIKRSRTKTVPTGACLILAFPNPDIGWDKVKPEVDRALLASGAAAVEESFDPGTQKRNRTRGGICCDDSISEYSDISDEEILLLARSENRMPSTLSEPGTSAPVSHLDGRHLQASPRQDCQPLSAFNTISILKEMEDSKKISSVSYAKAMTDDGLFSVDCVVVTLEGLKIHESGTAKSKKEAKSFAAAKVHKALTSCLNEECAAVNDVALSLAETNVHEAPATSNGSMSYRTALHSEGDRGGGENESDSASSHIYGEMPSYRDDSTVCSLSSLPRNLPIFISLLKEMEDSKKISSVSYAKAMTDDGLFSVDCVVVTLEGLKIHESGIAKSKKEAKSFAAAKVHKALTSYLNEECAAVNDVALSLAETNVHEAPATSNGSMSYRTALHSEGDRGGGENESDSASSHIYDEMSSYRDDSTQSSPALTMSKNCISLLKEMEDSMKILSVSYTEANDAVGLYTITCTATSLKEYRISGYSTANSKKVAKFSAAAKVYAYLCMERSAHAASDDASGESLKSTEMHRVPDDSDNSIGNLKELVDHNAIESVTYSDAELRSDGYFSVVCTVIKAAGLEITCSGAAANKKQAKKEAAWKALGAF